MAQSVERPTLDFDSSHGLMVLGLSSALGSALWAWSLLGSVCLCLCVCLSLPLSALPTLAHA